MSEMWKRRSQPKEELEDGWTSGQARQKDRIDHRTFRLSHVWGIQEGPWQAKDLGQRSSETEMRQSRAGNLDLDLDQWFQTFPPFCLGNIKFLNAKE